MKILLVAERYWPEVGAAPSRLANMAEGLKNQGNEVEVLTALPNYPKGKIFDGYRGRLLKKEHYEGVNLFRYWIYATVSKNPVARILNMFSFAGIIWLFALNIRKVKNYDLVIIQTPALVVAKSAMLLFKGLYHKKCVINVSDIWPLTAVDMGAMREGSLSYKYMKRCELYLYRKCDGVLGQSQEIVDHIKSYLPDSKKDKIFLYRNLQHYDLKLNSKSKGTPFKIVFSGMLGVAQNVAGIVKNVPFKEMGVEFHILGGGKQLSEIESWCKDHQDGNVYIHGFVAKEAVAEQLRLFDAGIIPLATRIRGAVPSKLYDTLPQGLPIIYAGGGEGAYFVEEHNLGYASEPGDYRSLEKNIIKMRDLSSEEYEKMSNRCLEISRTSLDFNKQMLECNAFLQLI